MGDCGGSIFVQFEFKSEYGFFGSGRVLKVEELLFIFNPPERWASKASSKHKGLGSLTKRMIHFRKVIGSPFSTMKRDSLPSEVGAGMVWSRRMCWTASWRANTTSSRCCPTRRCSSPTSMARGHLGSAMDHLDLSSIFFAGWQVIFPRQQVLSLPFGPCIFLTCSQL